MFNEKDNNNQSKQPIYFTWIGAPAKGIYAGHDLIGPDLFRQAESDRQITYVCLDEQVSYYREYFKDKNINVIGIQSYAQKNGDNDFAKFIDDVVADNINNENKSEVDIRRDNVTLKVASQLYLQTSQSGYFLDTNAMPSPNSCKSMLPNLEKYSCPYLEDKKIYDTWLMFSPNDDKTAKNRFNVYFSNVRDEYNNRKKKGKGINRSLISETLKNSLLREKPVNIKTSLNKNDPIDNTYDTDIGVRKRYYNSHGSHSTAAFIPRNFYILMTKDADQEFAYLINSGQIDVNKEFNMPDSTPYLTTLAVQAVAMAKYGTVNKLRIILPHIEDLDKKYPNPSNPEKTCTLLELAFQLNNVEFANMILQEKKTRIIQRDNESLYNEQYQTDYGNADDKGSKNVVGAKNNNTTNMTRKLLSTQNKKNNVNIVDSIKEEYQVGCRSGWGKKGMSDNLTKIVKHARGDTWFFSGDNTYQAILDATNNSIDIRNYKNTDDAVNALQSYTP